MSSLKILIQSYQYSATCVKKSSSTVASQKYAHPPLLLQTVIYYSKVCPPNKPK